jgi:hypothetical protein
LVKWGNLDYFGISIDTLSDKEKLINFVINRTKDRILHAVENNLIIFDNFKMNPNLIKDRLNRLDKNNYGKNFFGKINIREILYETIPKDTKIVEKNISRIKNYFSKMEDDNLLNEIKNDKSIIEFIVNIMKKELKISKFS